MKELISLLRSRNHGLIKERSLLGMVMGSEQEFGVHVPTITDLDDLDDFLTERVPNELYLSNGGKIYIDQHLEGCTPECTDIFDLIRYEKALERECSSIIGTDPLAILYKSNVDFESKNTFGAHESYTTHIPPNEKDREQYVLPSLLQKLLSGSGTILSKQFEITQRAKFIEKPVSVCTTSNRGLINTRIETLAPAKTGLYRFHHISNDANMCESALGLKMATTKIFLILGENGLLPHIPYDIFEAIDDLTRISRCTSSWHVRGTEHATDAVALLEKFADVAHYELHGMDRVLDHFIDLWRDTNKKLRTIERHPDALFGRLDWATKKYLFDTWRQRNNVAWDDDWIVANDIEYHRADSSGLYYQLQELNNIERQVTDASIEEARYTPPLTRAWCRGTVMQKYRDRKFPGGHKVGADWDGIWLSTKDNQALWSRKFRSLVDPHRDLLEELERELKTRQLL